MENFNKYLKIKQIGNVENIDINKFNDELIIEEKIDGANFRFTTSNGKLIFGSRSQQLSSDDGDLNNTPKNFNRTIEYIKERVKAIPAHNYIYYGESCHKHSLNYDWEKIPPFLGFDIFDLETNKFISYDEKIKLFNLLNLPVVPLIKRGIYGKDILEKDLSEIPNSIYVNNYAEGIVIKNYDKQIFAKYVSDKFKEINKKTFGMNKKFATNDTDYFVAKYCPNARIDKMVFKLIDEGNELDIKLMKDLPTKVYLDIWEEQWLDFATSKKVIDTISLKKKITQRCLDVLKQILINEALINDKRN
jgi:ATP-dependent RNA circularization protein (DNA/RNA ligase family)